MMRKGKTNGAKPAGVPLDPRDLLILRLRRAVAWTLLDYDMSLWQWEGETSFAPKHLGERVLAFKRIDLEVLIAGGPPVDEDELCEADSESSNVVAEAIHIAFGNDDDTNDDGPEPAGDEVAHG